MRHMEHRAEQVVRTEQVEQAVPTGQVEQVVPTEQVEQVVRTDPSSAGCEACEGGKS